VTSFVSDPLRDASDVIAGFVFQIDLTIQRWLELKDDEILELERGEDLDVIQLAGEDVPETRILEQMKRRSTSAISLKSGDALTAVAHFCEHRKNNPSVRLRFTTCPHTSASLCKLNLCTATLDPCPVTSSAY
jgi:hypothetical protein